MIHIRDCCDALFAVFGLHRVEPQDEPCECEPTQPSVQAQETVAEQTEPESKP